MANRQDYNSGDEFVPRGSAFKAAADPGQGPRNPQVQNLGPTAEVVFKGPVWGGVRDDDGARLMDEEHPRFKGRKMDPKAHLPENA